MTRADFLIVAGLGAVGIGLALVSPALGVIFGGLALCLLGLTLAADG